MIIILAIQVLVAIFANFRRNDDEEEERKIDEEIEELLDNIKEDSYGWESLNRTLVEFKKFLNKYI